MKRKSGNRLAVLSAAVAAGLLSARQASADVFIKAGNNDALNLATSWTHGSDVPGSDDIAVWDATAGATSTVLGGNLHWLGLRVESTHSGDVTFGSSNTLTLGAAGLLNAANVTVQLNSQIALSADQSWTKLGAGLIIAQSNPVALNGFTLTESGVGGTIQHKTVFNGAGRINIEHADVRWEGSRASDATVWVGLGNRLWFNGGVTGARATNLILNGSQLLISNTLTNQVDSISGGLTLASGHSIMTIGTNATRTELVDAGSFTREAGATMLVRGTGLGTGGLSPLTIGTANLKLGGTIALSGGGGTAGQSTIGILKGIFGDSSGVDGNGQGLVTYDSTFGVRLLNTTSEYTNSITNQQSQLDNVRLTVTSGAAVTHTLSGASTVNSLSLAVSTTANSGLTVAGGTLKLASGVLFAQSSNPASTAASQMTVNSTLDFNGGEGIIYVNTVGQSGNIGGALLNIEGDLTNAQGLVIAGSGTVRLGGTTATAHTGPTTLNSGTLLLAKSGAGANQAIRGNLVLNGGRLLMTFSEQVADDVNVTINGGIFDVREASNSGTGKTESINNLVMTGGQVTGAAGSGGGFNANNVTITGGTLSVTRGKRFNVAGHFNLAPTNYWTGTVTIDRANSSSSAYDSALTVVGGLSISAPDQGAYTPFSLAAGTSATNRGGRLVLTSDLTFTGNSTNSNTVTIDAAAGTSVGSVALSGNRTFTIGNGAAAIDLTLVAPLENNGATAGGLIKQGAGTLALNGNNTYSSQTQVLTGTLSVGGSIAGSEIAVAAGAILVIGDNSETADNLAIENTTALTLATGSLVNLNFNSTETIGALTLGTTTFYEGTFNASTHDAFFDGAGSLIATPEPASLSLLAMGGMGLLARRRRTTRHA